MRETCRWCGKQYDSGQAFLGGVQKNQSYCSKRCENAGERARQKEREELKQFEKEHPLFKFFIIGIFAIIMIFGFVEQRGNSEKKAKETEQETAVTQSSSEEKNFVHSVNQQEIDRETEDMTMDYNINMLDGIEEVFSEESEIEEIDEKLFEDHGIAMVEEEDFSNQRIYDIVDEMPVFPGGDYELIKYIDENLNYPQDAIERGIQGRVFVKIIVEPNGIISNAKIIRGLGYGCDEEAVRVVESMPNWKPGRKNGETVRVNMAIPVNFKLQ